MQSSSGLEEFQLEICTEVVKSETNKYATFPWMYLISRIFSSSNIAFTSYKSLDFIFGLRTLLMTVMLRLLATTSKVQVTYPALLVE
ncbi:hypothetical protein CB1_000476002 [Camelus ferus]|nr:hypothetical protein CB1_000476002 [Camelus ferus]